MTRADEEELLEDWDNYMMRCGATTAPSPSGSGLIYGRKFSIQIGSVIPYPSPAPRGAAQIPVAYFLKKLKYIADPRARSCTFVHAVRARGRLCAAAYPR